MKALVLSLALLTGFAAHADDSFDIVKDGRTYTCRAQTPSSPGGSVDCANKAYSGPFNRDESLALCQGAYDTSPADCANKAYSGAFNKQEAISLCIGARSVGPADCANKSYSGPFNKDESVTLCKNDGSIARAECAIRAYSGPYSKEQAIQLCIGTNPAMMNVVLKDLNKERAVGFDAILKRANSKAAVEGVLK
jgi:hypothetical protein